MTRSRTRASSSGPTSHGIWTIQVGARSTASGTSASPPGARQRRSRASSTGIYASEAPCCSTHWPRPISSPSSAFGAGEERVDEGALFTGAGLAADQHEARLAPEGGGEVLCEARELGRTADDRGLRAGGGGRGAVRRRRRGEARVLLEDPSLEIPERRRGVDADLLGQGAAGLLVGGEGLRLSVAAIEGEHELAARALA